MTTTTTGTTHQDPMVRTRRSALWLAAAFALGGALGTGATAIAIDDGSGPRVARTVASDPAAPAANASTGDRLSITPDAGAHCLASQDPARYASMTPDAAEQWALAEREARYASMTPDAAEQWALAEREARC